MKLNLFFVLGALFFLSAGCAGLKKEQAVASYSFDGKVLDQERLKSGGKIYLVPFSADVGVEASETLDEAALMLIKGVYEELSSTKTSLEVLTSEHGISPDFIVRGHFVKIAGSQKKPIVSIEGEVVERTTGKVLIHFSDEKAGAGPDDHRALGYEIGKDVGRFILSAVH